MADRTGVEDLLRRVEYTAFCFEVMAGEPESRWDRKHVDWYERGDLERLAKFGRPGCWSSHVETMVEAGKRIERVRVCDYPPTAFQAMHRWMGTWNVAAGESVR